MKRSNWTVAAAIYLVLALFVAFNKNGIPALTALLGQSTIIQWLFLPSLIMLCLGKISESTKSLHLRISYLADQNDKLRSENILIMDKLLSLESANTGKPENPNPLKQQEEDDSP